MKNLMISGSASFQERVDEVMTEYSFKINKSLIKRQAFEECKKDFMCRDQIESEAFILNKLYNRVTNQNLDKPVERYEKTQRIYEASLNPIKDDLYTLFHEFLTETETV